MKGHQNLEQMLGKQGKVSIPTATSSLEEIAAYRAAVGVPPTPKDYKISEIKELNGKPMPEGLWEQPMIDGYVAKFHELGIPPAQAEALIKYGMEQEMGRFTSITDIVNKQKSDSEAKLKSEWGSEYGANVALAEKGASVVGLTADQVAADPMLANNPTFLRAMKAVGLMSKEDSAAGARGSQRTMINPDVRMKELQALMGARDYRKTSAYLNHDDHMRELSALVALKEKMRG